MIIKYHKSAYLSHYRHHSARVKKSAKIKIFDRETQIVKEKFVSIKQRETICDVQAVSKAAQFSLCYKHNTLFKYRAKFFPVYLIYN